LVPFLIDLGNSPSMTAAGGRMQWSDDAFLDSLRDASDPAADACVAALPPEESLQFVFSKMRTDADLPSVLPAAFLEFARATREALDLGDLTADDRKRVERGQKFFMTHALDIVIALLCKSIME